MGTAGRGEDLDVTRVDLLKRLLEHPGRFNFFQAVRLLYQLSRQRQPVSRLGPPNRELVRFKVNNQLKFPSGQIEEVSWPDNQQAEMWVNFMGLTGPAGVMPYVFTEFIAERLSKRDRCTRDFFDIFNHRMISLFYRAWEKHHVFVSFERDPHQRFSLYLRSLIGIETDGLRNRLPLSDQALVYYTGLLSLQSRSATALEQLLEDYFQIPVEVEQFVGSWYKLQSRDRCSFRDRPSMSDQLGVGVVVGDAVWDQQCRVRIKLGPLSAERYLDFLPQGKSYSVLQSLTEFFGKGQLEFEVQLILKRQDVPACKLGGDNHFAPMLNWLSWLKCSSTFDRNPADTILYLN